MKYIKKPVVDNELNGKYPNRHKEIHASCCKDCPSNINKINGTADLESEDIRKYPKDIIAQHFLFVCAWRPNKLCKGNCDEHGIDENYIKSRNNFNELTAL